MRPDIIIRDVSEIVDRLDFEEIRNKTLLVTGASGLIGTYLLACLHEALKRGLTVKVYAQMLSDPPPHISAIVDESGFEILRKDLSDPSACNELPCADLMVHCAGYAQPTLFMANPASTILVNTTATAALLTRVNAGGRFLFLSSSEVYSGLLKPAPDESEIGTTTPYHPRSSYIEGKRCGEAICSAFLGQGIHAMSARVGHTYGPGTRKHDKRALYSFIEKALSKGKIELRDQGRLSRTYCYVSDLVEMLWLVLLRGKETVYNVGGHSTVTIADLAKMIGKLTDSAVIFPAVNSEVSGAPDESRLDLTRIESEFHKTGFVDMEEGLRRTIEWQRELYKE